jgi:hypothetical protein
VGNKAARNSQNAKVEQEEWTPDKAMERQQYTEAEIDQSERFGMMAVRAREQEPRTVGEARIFIDSRPK